MKLICSVFDKCINLGTNFSLAGGNYRRMNRHIFGATESTIQYLITH